MTWSSTKDFLVPEVPRGSQQRKHGDKWMVLRCCEMTEGVARIECVPD